MCESFKGAIALLFDEVSSFSAPAAFGTFRVLHQVGSGVLGPVFRTSDPRRVDLVAVKAFKLDLRPDDVVRLADALRRLAVAPPAHPALARIVDAGLEDTTPFLATEYLIGDTLDVILRRRAPLPLGEALGLIRPVAAGLDEAWSAGVGHGALHPRDVFVGPGESGIRITGIGIAQAIESAGLSAPLRRPYSAPERAGKRWDQRADVYSLAVIAHELLTGRRPAGPTEQDGVFASDVTPEQRVVLRRVLGRALAEQPDERFPSSTAFVEALAAVDAAVAAGRSAPLPAIDTGLAVDTLGVVEAHPETADPTLLAADLTGLPTSDEMAIRASDDELPMSTAAERMGTGNHSLDADPIDLAYRPAEDAAWGDQLRPEGHHPVPGWLASASAAPAASRRTRWGLIVVICLIAGGGAGYLAGTYDPLDDAETSRLTDRQPSPAATLPDPETPPDVPAVPAQPLVVEPVTLPPPVTPPAPAAVASAAPPRAAPTRDVAPAAAPAPPPGGALQVRSEPSGAMVTLDGRLMGETPLVLRDLAAGPYLLRVAHPGYAPHSERVTIASGGSDTTVRVALEAGVTSPGTALGAIDIDSEPRGARVLIDGRFVGQSPLRVPELRPGPHTVTLELADHSSVTRRAVVEPGRTAKVIINLR
jgi:serine/threonine-protein kinase